MRLQILFQSGRCWESLEAIPGTAEMFATQKYLIKSDFPKLLNNFLVQLVTGWSEFAHVAEDNGFRSYIHLGKIL